MLNILVDDPIPNEGVYDEYRVCGLTSCFTLTDYKRWCESKTPSMFAKVLYLYGEYQALSRI